MIFNPILEGILLGVLVVLVTLGGVALFGGVFHRKKYTSPSYHDELKFEYADPINLNNLRGF